MNFPTSVIIVMSKMIEKTVPVFEIGYNLVVHPIAKFVLGVIVMKEPNKE